MDKQEVLEKYQECKDHYSELYDACEEDWKFLHGEGQWDNKAVEARKKNGKPHLVLNQLLPYAHQVVNDIRQARISIRTSPVDDEADVETSEVLQGIIRNIERQSDANSAYTTASLNAVGSGIGWIKVRTDYADTDTFDQEAYVERIMDFSSVYLEPNFQRIDGGDAEYGFILDKYTKDRYQELWPDREPISFDTDCGDEEVVVANFYYKSYENSKLYQVRYINLDGSETISIIRESEKEVLDEAGIEYEILMERDVKIPTVKDCLYDGHEDPIEQSEFPCKFIPIVPVIGQEVYLDGRREFHSLIRQAKDAQKMYNYHKSESTYVMALQPRAPMIGPKGSFKSAANKWADANRTNHAFLEYDIVHDANGQRAEPPTRAPAIQGSQALMQEAIGARDDIRLAIGMPQSNMGEAAGEISGVAIRNRQVEGDNATFHFVDNLAASISQVGRILVDIIPRIYSERKIARIIGEDGTEKNVPINTPFVKQDGEITVANNPQEANGIYKIGVGKYDVVCDVGASYSSKRQETADKLIQLVGAKPELADVTADLLFEALDLPMSKEIANRLKAVMDPALLEDDPMAAKAQKATQALKAMEEQLMNYQAALQDKQDNKAFEENVKLRELKIEADKSAATIAKTYAEIEKMRAETTGFNPQAIQALGNAVQGINDQVNDIGQALTLIMDAEEGKQGEQATSEPDNSEIPQD